MASLATRSASWKSNFWLAPVSSLLGAIWLCFRRIASVLGFEILLFLLLGVSSFLAGLRTNSRLDAPLRERGRERERCVCVCVPVAIAQFKQSLNAQSTVASSLFAILAGISPSSRLRPRASPSKIPFFGPLPPSSPPTHHLSYRSQGKHQLQPLFQSAILLGLEHQRLIVDSIAASSCFVVVVVVIVIVEIIDLALARLCRQVSTVMVRVH